MENQQENHSQTIEILQEKILNLEQDLAEKNKTINKISSHNNSLQFQVDQLKRLIYGSKRERFVPTLDAQQLNLEFEPKAAEVDEQVKAERELIRVNYQRKQPQKKHQGRLSLPAHLPVVETIVEPAEDVTNMVCIGHEITDELDLTPARLHINRTIRPKYITKEDASGNQRQVIAELNRPIPKCIASAALIASIFTDKYIYHLPLYRILKRINQMGVSLPSSTLESWVKLGAELIRPLYAVHRLHVFREIYQMIDESPIRVQDKDKKGACHQGYMWVRYAPLPKSVLFEYYPSRSTKRGPIDDLHTFTGFIQTDGYAGYTYLASVKGLTHLSCWAHARRYFEKAMDNDQARAAHVMKLIQLLYAIEALAREAQMTPEQRHELRLDKSLSIINEMGQYIHQERGNVLPQSPIGKAFDYCANHWTSLQNYLQNGILEIDSNLVENAIRPLALGRKNYLFAGSHDAAKDIAMFYSFFATCTKHDIDPQKWLTYVINNINDTKNSQLKNLLPQFIDKNLFS
ncbi:MAG: IS66 family transposase [Lentimicrobium sp.]|nr:IS66 family transposase [Lentimicrobium sp.]